MLAEQPRVMVRKNSGNLLVSTLILILVLAVDQSNAARRPRQLGVQNGMMSSASPAEGAQINYREMKNLPPFPFPLPSMPLAPPLQLPPLPFAPPLQLPPLPFAPPLQLPPLPFSPPFEVPSVTPFPGFPLPPVPFLSPPLAVPPP